jgi:hypothetical protein
LLSDKSATGTTQSAFNCCYDKGKGHKPASAVPRIRRKSQINRTNKKCGENKGDKGTKRIVERQNKMRICFNVKKKEEGRRPGMTTRQ